MPPRLDIPIGGRLQAARFLWRQSSADSGNAEVLSRKAEKLAERPDVGGLESLVACQSAEPKARQIDLCAELVLDLLDELAECRAVPSEK